MIGDEPGSGFILEDGNIIPVDLPALDALNKFAADVIKVQVSDYVADLDEDDEGDFDRLKENFLNALGKRGQEPRSKTLPNKTSDHLSSPSADLKQANFAASFQGSGQGSSPSARRMSVLPKPLQTVTI